MAWKKKMDPISPRPQTLSDDEERAVVAFERYLEQWDQRGEPPPFEACAERHPRERERLLEMMEGLRRFDAVRRAVREKGERVPAARPRRWGRRAAVAAACLSAATIALFLDVPGPSRPAPPSPYATAARAVLAPLVAYGALHPAQWDEVSSTALDDLATCFAAARRLAAETPSLGTEEEVAELRVEVERFRARLASTAGERGERLLKSLASDRVVDRVEGLIDPQVRFMVAVAAPDPPAVGSPPRGVSAEILEERRLAKHPQFLSLRIIDLDAGGAETDDVDVFAQPANLYDGSLGRALYLGRPPDLQLLPPGDFRVTVVDDARGRYSELRVLVLPGTPIPPRIAFLRDSSVVTADMVRISPATIPYGATRDLGDVMHRDEVAADVEGFWIDPGELTNEEYSRFYRETRAHPQWFADGHEAAPVLPTALAPDGLPIFDQNGICRAEFARHPIVQVTWNCASLCANWAGKRLLTDREWERAAGGAAGTRYPWGDDYDESRVDASRTIGAQPHAKDGDTIVIASSGIGTSSVDDRPNGQTRDGVLRMSDNVAEWVEDLFSYTRARDASGALRFFSIGEPPALSRCVRGSSWQLVSSANARVDARRLAVPSARSIEIGLRCAKSMTPDVRRE